MCTVITLIRPGHAWPVVLAANRDESLHRDWDLPAEHWADRPGVIAGRDRSGAFFVRGVGHGAPLAEPLPSGLAMVTAHDPNDPDSPRVARYLSRFAAAPAPDPGNWTAWEAMLADRSGGAAEQLNVIPRGGFGTVCSSLVALPRDDPPIWLFAPGPPHEAGFAPLW